MWRSEIERADYLSRSILKSEKDCGVRVPTIGQKKVKKSEKNP